MVHRDVKRQIIIISNLLTNRDTYLFCSSNVLLGKDGKGVLIAKLADFGLSSYLHGITESFYDYTPVGTETHMSPEAIKGRVSPTVDIYAFGMVAATKRSSIVVIHCFLDYV